MLLNLHEHPSAVARASWAPDTAAWVLFSAVIVCCAVEVLRTWVAAATHADLVLVTCLAR